MLCLGSILHLCTETVVLTDKSSTLLSENDDLGVVPTNTSSLTGSETFSISRQYCAIWVNTVFDWLDPSGVKLHRLNVMGLGLCTQRSRVFFGLAILAGHPGSGLGLLSSCVLFCACPLLAGVCVCVGVFVSGRPVYRHCEAWWARRLPHLRRIMTHSSAGQPRLEGAT